MVDQPFATSEMGESMDADLLPELSGETWVASALIEEFTVLDFLVSCTVGGYKWAICPSVQMASYGGVERRRRRAHNWWSPGVIRRFHDSLFAGHLGISRTVFSLQTRVYWPGLRQDVICRLMHSVYAASCTVCIARKSPCP